MAQYDFITAEEFNILKDRVNAECQRRTKEANQYNNNPIKNPNIKTVQKQEIVREQEFNQILENLNRFNVFPGLNLLDVSYQDGQVIVGDYIFPLEGFGTIISQLENEPRVNNDDCRAGCTGLCTNSCSDACSGCTGSCVGSCAGGCEGGCTSCEGGCNTGCGASCTHQCYWSCGGGCEGFCEGYCSGCLHACSGPRK